MKKAIKIDEFLAFIKQLEGKRIKTISLKSYFTLELVDTDNQEIRFIMSTGNPNRMSRSDIKAFISFINENYNNNEEDRYNTTNFKDSFNQSYFLALLKLYDKFNYKIEQELKIEEYKKHAEGKLCYVPVTRYERNKNARNECLEYYGYNCCVCGVNFEKMYGEIGKKYIHVHHLKELSLIGTEYIIDPIKDLRPVCPNCHSMLHKTIPAMTIKDLQQLLNFNYSKRV